MSGRLPKPGRAPAVIALAAVMGFAGAGGLAGCQGHGGEEPPAIVILADDAAELPYVVAINQWNGSIVDRAPIWDIYKSAHDPAQAPVVALGAHVSIQFPDPAPTRLELQDQVYVADGDNPLGLPTAVELDGPDGDGRYSFQLNVNALAMVSSDTADYEPGGIVRGFTLTAAWGPDECEYAFALRTDAHCEPADAPYCQFSASSPAPADSPSG
ncbi:MAG: hypothetical protein LBD70_05355 [Bifidobacteriaceae bacterium]|jgi:hypothetical protein|nr:hypothetical protein [Bifidobacteriaceae bacterium]